MRSRTTARSLPYFVGLLVAALGAACSDPPTAPTPVLITDTFTGTIAPAGLDAKPFVVKYQADYSDASVTITGVTTVANATPLTITLGVGFGRIATDGSCARDPSYSSAAAVIGQELTAEGVFLDGTYCIQVFDAGTLTEPVAYSLTVKHY
jgi:hypothetical protein